MLVDTHSHVDARQFDADREAVIQAARGAGVGMLVDAGCDLPSSRAAVDLAAQNPGQVFAAVGIHPHDASTYSDEALAELQELAQRPDVVAIGETGLDYYRMHSPREQQLHSLERQLALARELGLPVILHNRESHEDLMATLREHARGLRGVFHCFSGDRNMAEECLAFEGFYLSFAGPLTYRANTALQEVAASAPLDRVLVETDCPYLTPHPYRGRRNEPKHVTLTAAKLAELRGLSNEEIAEITTRNARALFGLVHAAV
ncbi:MAG TPA: TatD family hydrolase [Ktedonobacterales bacterium]|nr:TatD family hydrolase [Ktedonobacterales bacterium]